MFSAKIKDFCSNYYHDLLSPNNTSNKHHSIYTSGVFKSFVVQQIIFENDPIIIDPQIELIHFNSLTSCNKTSISYYS